MTEPIDDAHRVSLDMLSWIKERFDVKKAEIAQFQHTLGPSCKICGRLLDNPEDMPASADCGGDCRSCLAELGDPDEMLRMREVTEWTRPRFWFRT